MRPRLTQLPLRAQVFATALIVALPAASIIVYSGLQARAEALRDATLETERLADEIASHYLNLVAGAEQLLSTLSQLPDIRGREAERVHSLLASLLQLNAQYTNLLVADATGRVWAQGLDGPSFGVADRRYFRNAVASGRLAAGEYVISRATGRPTFNLAVPFRDAGGAVAGAIIAGINVGAVRRLMSLDSQPAGASYVLLDHRGVVLARDHHPEEVAGRPYPAELFQRIATGSDRGAWTGAAMEGDERRLSYRRLRLEGDPAPDLFVVASLPIAPAVSTANLALIANVALLTPFLLLAALLAWLLGERSVGRPVRLLQGASRRVAAGDLQVRVADLVPGGDLGALARTFDAMAHQLEEREAEQRRLQDQLLQAQKMESVGRLAGGVAHDFNNLLTVINGHCDLLADRPEVTPPMRQDLELIRQAGESAANLTRQLLAFSRKQLRQPRVLDLNEVVVRIDRMLRRVIGEDVRLVALLEQSPWPVHADPGQIEQVLVNLAVNARDAMPRGGTLTIETSNVVLDEAYARSHQLVTPGEYALLAVSDTGEGMDRATLERVFEPFFTTKPEGRGTGLGLSTVYGIVAQSGGHVAAYSELGHGTTFKVYLPRHREGGRAASAPERRPAPAAAGATVLLAEDSDGVRDLVREVLSQLGYLVLEARTGDEALVVAASHEGPIDLLLTDVVMPGLGGRQLAERLVALRPAVRVLYMSGYTEDATLSQGLLQASIDFLEKPFTTSDLADKVGEVLARATATPP